MPMTKSSIRVRGETRREIVPRGIEQFGIVLKRPGSEIDETPLGWGIG
jgi:hypothetical protein